MWRRARKPTRRVTDQEQSDEAIRSGCVTAGDGSGRVFRCDSQWEQRSTVLIAGRSAGTEVYLVRGDDHSVHLSFNDRGRGPDTTVRWRLDAHQLPTSIRITGNDYFKSRVDESFSNERGVANWKSAAEQGSLAGATAHFYVPMESPPMFIGMK